jgi:hypothetical protein
MYNLILDDERDVMGVYYCLMADMFITEKWEIVKNFKEFKDCIQTRGIPKIISFDHDLGEEMTGNDCAKFMLNYCIESGLPFPKCFVHSQNPVGKQNILHTINFYERNSRKYS